VCKLTIMDEKVTGGGRGKKRGSQRPKNQKAKTSGIHDAEERRTKTKATFLQTMETKGGGPRQRQLQSGLKR